MKSISLFILLFLFFCNTAFSSEYRFDGYAWNEQDYKSKHMYVYGYLDGLSMANQIYRQTIDNWGRNIADPFSIYEGETLKFIPKEEYLKNFGFQCSDQVDQLISVWITGPQSGVLSVSDLKQIIDGMNSFYSDYRNKKILVEDALSWVCEDLRGKTSKDRMQKALEFWRTHPKPQMF